jgi:hypothetical protein
MDFENVGEQDLPPNSQYKTKFTPEKKGPTEDNK